MSRPADDPLSEAIEHVLETVCFSQVQEAADSAVPIEEPVSMRIRFRGAPSGEFRLKLGEETAASLARAFLGREDVCASETTEVALELANMLCGCYLSRMDSSRLFDLSAPELAPWETAAARRFVCDEGPMDVAILLENGA